jgi:alkyl sulfatase BDS1-like metallo-beta-lactamase superfamily hydrolase
MKTKQANKDYTCAECKEIIHKGDRVARRTVTIGYYGTWGHSKECKCCYGVMPDWAATEPVRDAMPICDHCANGAVAI